MSSVPRSRRSLHGHRRDCRSHGCRLDPLSFIAAGFGLILEVDPRPGRLAPVAVICALVAGRMSVRFQRLAFWAVIVAMIGWTLGMTLAVITENPII